MEWWGDGEKGGANSREDGEDEQQAGASGALWTGGADGQASAYGGNHALQRLSVRQRFHGSIWCQDAADYW